MDGEREKERDKGQKREEDRCDGDIKESPEWLPDDRKDRRTTKRKGNIAKQRVAMKIHP